jgi:hypothetical protein
MPGISSAERRRLARHLPDDFDRLPPTDQEQILRSLDLIPEHVIRDGVEKPDHAQDVAAIIHR